ncbi:hypothetical protein BGZ57DRAFT_936941 [Hyaloscypha finlandica]|nr:hypothetical protein BGZ57DRAFT_936941 [Hyaloscypha finlandica]
MAITGGLALDPIDYTLNSVRRSGVAELVNVVADLWIHDREGLRGSPNDEPKPKLRCPLIDIDEDETPRLLIDINNDFWIEEDESEASGEY